MRARSSAATSAALCRPGELPDVAVLEIFGEDPDGEPLGAARGMGRGWPRADRPGAAGPRRSLRSGARRAHPRAHQSRSQTGRCLLKRGSSSGWARVPIARLAWSQSEPGQLARVEPVDRKSRTPSRWIRAASPDLKDGDLVTVEPMAGRGFAGPRARIVERLGSIREPRSISLIAIHAHGIPDRFPTRSNRRGRTRQSVGDRGPQGFAEIPARDDRS